MVSPNCLPSLVHDTCREPVAHLPRRQEERVMPAPGDTEQKCRDRENAYTPTLHISPHSRVAGTLIVMLVDVDSPHKLIAVYNPESRVTPHSLLAWLAQCEDAFKIFNSRNADKPLAMADQIRILGHAMQEPSMQQWWMQGREKYLEMTIDDWIGAIKERWLSTSGVNDATRICYGLKQGHKDFNAYTTELAYHRNIVGDIIIPEITYKNLLLFGAHPLLMYDMLALPKFDACAPELTSSELESIMSTRWDAIWLRRCKRLRGCERLWRCKRLWGREWLRGGQEGTVGMEAQQVEKVLGVQEVQEGPELELVRVAQPLLEEGLAPVAQPVLEGQVVEQAAQVVWVAR
ncbi:hypothetical protein DFH08DRAFT_1051153 [Mycena albidolilacea]|uniref:Retrotransposon gag domain-containing protein n=1 Tax=Mycena albidolilacea TaxID=1033008 RepID=A0AAD6Z5F1_9AGAR|nr:hypothetical protein DFH08DRAFT_1051153 [Mycena albidolilacea]